VTWTRLSLSILALSVLHEEIAVAHHSPLPLLFAEPRTSKAVACESGVSLLDSLGGISQEDDSTRRWLRDISVSCESRESILRRFDHEGAAGLAPLAFDPIFISDILAQDGQVDRASALRKSMPEISGWYVGLGTIAIEQMGDEQKGREYLRLAEEINPIFDKNKASLYKYFCLISIRERSAHLSPEACEQFDWVQQTAFSQLWLGERFSTLGDYERATVYFQEAIRLEQSSPMKNFPKGDAYLNLGESLIAIGKLFEAERAYTNGTLQDPQYAWNYFKLAQLEARKGCYRTARRYLQSIAVSHQQDTLDAADRLIESIGQRNDDAPGCSW